MTDDEKKRIEDLLEDLDALPEIPEETDTAIVSAWMCSHQTSNIWHTKSQNLNVSSLVLQLSLPNLLHSGVKSRMKM